MSRTSGVLAAMKAAPGRRHHGPPVRRMGRTQPVAANAMFGNPRSQSGYGPFLPRPSDVFTDGAFGPMSPIQPVPVDEPAVPGGFPDPRLWQYRVGWNLPTQPRTEGLALASFDQLRTLADRYSVARACIELRREEIRGLEWSIELTTKAAKAYQGDHKAMRDFGERAAEATRFFRHPDPDFWSFNTFLDALLEEIFVYDALSLVFRPKYGKGLGRGLLGSDLDHIKLVSGPTIRPLLDMHGGKPRPPAPAYQQFLYGVPRSDYQTVISGTDIDDYGLTGAQINQFRADVMLYAPLTVRRESPYGSPPVERALLPIISGLQKQEYQLSYYTEGTVPAVYISPGDPNMTPTQVRELQDALNGIAGDPAYHMKVIVLPPGSKVEPQRPVDLSDTFDTLVQTQVCMSFDVMPDELGLLPNVGSAGAGGSSNASALRFAGQEARDLKSRKSTKPLLMFLCDIFNYVLQDICGQPDMQFSFEGLVDDEDKQQITSLGVEQVQNGISSIDEVRERLDMPPWGLTETSEPVVFTAQGPIPFSMAPQLIAGMLGGGAGGQGTNSGQRTPSSRSRTSQPSVRRGGQTKPNGSHEAPLAPHREAATPAHSAAAGAIQSPTPRTGGTTSRSSVAGSRKKAVEAELGALGRHLRKGRLISTWEARHIPGQALSAIAEDIAKGVLIDTAVERAGDICLKGGLCRDLQIEARIPEEANCPRHAQAIVAKAAHWPGWERDLGLVGAYKNLIGQAFHDAEARGSALRKKAATGGMFVSNGVLRDLISDEVREVFSAVLTPLWTEAWHLGYASAKSLVTGQPADFTAKDGGEHLQGFIGTEGEHWLSEIARTGLGNNSARSELIARTEAGRAIASAALQCYRDNGVQSQAPAAVTGRVRHLQGRGRGRGHPSRCALLRGGVLGLSHPADRCCPGPSWVDAEPPLARPGEGQRRTRGPVPRRVPDAPRPPPRGREMAVPAAPAAGRRMGPARRQSRTWARHAHAAAVRESTRGDRRPALSRFAAGRHASSRTRTRPRGFTCTRCRSSSPRNNGSTPGETAGTGWFKRREVGDLDLHPPFRAQWEAADWRASASPSSGPSTRTGKSSPSPRPHSASRRPGQAGHIRTGPTARNTRREPLGTFRAAPRGRWAQPNRRTGSTTWPSRSPTTPWSLAAAMTARCPRAGASRTPRPAGSRIRATRMTTRGRNRRPPSSLPVLLSVPVPGCRRPGRRPGTTPGIPSSAPTSRPAPKPVAPGSVPPVTFDPADGG